MARIIRALWGCDQPNSRWAKVFQQDVHPVLQRAPTCPQTVYCYGRNNADLLAGHGYEVTLVDESPWPDGKADFVQGKQFVRPWHYKLQLIRQAVEDHGEVIYCDWDVACLVKDASAAFAQLEGRRMSLSAYMYWRHRHPTREGKARQICVTGNWLHFRDMEFIDAILSRMQIEKAWWRWHDELVMGHLIDEMHGGWPGEAFWLERYESPIMVQRHQRSPWQVTQEDPRFVRRLTPVPFVWEKLFIQYGRRA